MKRRNRHGIVKGYKYGPINHRKKSWSLTMEYFLWAWDHQLIYKVHCWIKRVNKTHNSKVKRK